MSDGGTRPIWVDAMLSRDLTPVEYRTWSYLFWRQGDNTHAWPSQAAIAGDLGLTIDGVRKIVGRLVDKGWLTLRQTGGGRGHTIQYSVCKPQTAVWGSGPKPQTAVQGFGGETPDSETPFLQETPDSGAEKPQTAEPRHKGRTLTRTHTKEKSLSSDAVRLAELLLDLIVARKSDFKRPNLTTWAQEIDRMIRLDHRTREKIEDIIRWSQRDPFWSLNILSPSKLRQKFDQLELRMKGSNYGRQKSTPLRDDIDYGCDMYDVRTGAKVPGVRC